MWLDSLTSQYFEDGLNGLCHHMQYCLKCADYKGILILGDYGSKEKNMLSTAARAQRTKMAVKGQRGDLKSQH